MLMIERVHRAVRAYRHVRSLEHSLDQANIKLTQCVEGLNHNEIREYASRTGAILPENAPKKPVRRANALR